MRLKDDWQDVNRILTKSGDAVRGDLEKNELVEYTESLANVQKYGVALSAAIGGFLIPDEVGFYIEDDTNKASGLDDWEEIATAGFSGVIIGGIAHYGTIKFAEYVDEQHNYE